LINKIGDLSMKNWFKILILFILISSINLSVAYGKNEKQKIIYFYSSTCSTCADVQLYFDKIKSEHDIEIIKYNILDIKNNKLLEKYSKEYLVVEDKREIIPAVFISDKYFIGKKEITKNLVNEIMRENKVETKLLKVSNINYDNEKFIFNKMNIISVAIAGLINGLNPCSISMLLFFISMIKIRKEHLLKVGLGFCLGKYITFFMLGTLIYKLLINVQVTWINTFIKGIFLIIIIVLVILNINDYVASKKEKYNKIKLQLPLKLRKLNHKMMKKITKIQNIKTMIIISFFLGAIISLGEFLCTGQIYLATIVTIFQTNADLKSKSILFFSIYNIGLILPLMCITFVIYKGKEIFDLSEIIRGKMHCIKLANIILLIVFGIMVISGF